MYLVIAGVLGLVLKYLEIGPFAVFSWWVVLTPFALAIAWWTWADSSGYTKRRETEREAKRVARRRQRHLEDLGLGQGPRRKT